MTVLIEKRVESYTEAYNNYYPLVFSMVYARLSNVDETKDICQEVFIRFYESFDKVENHRGWLYGTLRNVTLEYFRNSKKQEAREEIIDDVSMAFVNGFRDTRLIIQEAIESMENFIDEKERLLFELIAINNLSYLEAGKHLEMTEHQSRYKYGQIKDRIIRYLQKKGIARLEDLL